MREHFHGGGIVRALPDERRALVLLSAERLRERVEIGLAAAHGVAAVFKGRVARRQPQLLQQLVGLGQRGRAGIVPLRARKRAKAGQKAHGVLRMDVAAHEKSFDGLVQPVGRAGDGERRHCVSGHHITCLDRCSVLCISRVRRSRASSESII